MDNGIELASVIANRGLNFSSPYGYGHGGAGFGNFGSDGSVINARTEANGDLLRQILTDNKLDRLSDKVSDNKTQALESELRMADRISRQTEEMLKCCCENRLAAERNAGKLDVIKQELDDRLPRG